MKIKRKIKIEIDRIKIANSQDAGTPNWCGICNANAEFLELSDAAQLVSTLYREEISIDEKDLHFYRNGNSQPLICLNSIINKHK